MRTFFTLIFTLLLFSQVHSQGQQLFTGVPLYEYQGYIGIGTSSPTTRLEVVGGNIAGSNAVISKGQNGVWAGTATFIDYIPSLNYGRVGVYDYATNSWKNLFLGNGNVGIGTISPTDKLEVIGNFVSRVSPGSNRLARIANSNSAGELHLFTGNSSSVVIDANGNSYLNGGNVGIGTTTPTNKLEVNGTIRTKKVKVEASSWPDYVFEPGYQPLSLPETEAFIKTHKHLPEVPSAQEIEEKGQDLGAVQTVLLKKIEEMTLQMIEMNKKIEKQDQRIELLEEENRDLKTKTDH